MRPGGSGWWLAVAIAMVCSGLAVALTSRGGLWRPAPLEDGVAGPEARWWLNLVPEQAQVGEPIVIDIWIENPGPDPITSLALASTGDWSGFRMAQLDIDGAVHQQDGMTVFRFNGGVRPGKVRRLRLVAVPLRRGTYRFRLQPYGRTAGQGALLPLRRSRGEPLEQVVAVTVL